MDDQSALSGFLPREGRLWLLVAGGLLLAGWIKGINLLILLAFLMMALWVVNLIASFRQMRGIRGRRIPRGPFSPGMPVCGMSNLPIRENPLRRVAV